MESSNENLRFYVYFEANRGIKAKEICEQLQIVFGDNASRQAFVYKWLKEFTSGQRDSVQHLPHPGRPVSKRTDANISRVFDFVDEHPKSTIAYISGSLHLSKESACRILVDDLFFHKVCSVWIPHHLTEANKLQRVGSAHNLLNLINCHGEFELLRLFSTQDETWIPFNIGNNKEGNKVWIAPQKPAQLSCALS